MLDTNKYIGVPFVDKGRMLSEGVDCWGLIREFYKNEFDIILPSLDAYYTSIKDRSACSSIIDTERKNWDCINSGDEREGDVIMLRLRGRPWHVGVVLANKRMLHVTEGCNTVIEKYNGSLWRGRVYGFVRYRKQPVH